MLRAGPYVQGTTKNILGKVTIWVANTFWWSDLAPTPSEINSPGGMFLKTSVVFELHTVTVSPLVGPKSR